MLVFSLLSLGLSFRIEERARSLVPDRVQNSIVQLALAQHRYISDPDNPDAGSYANDISRVERLPADLGRQTRVLPNRFLICPTIRGFTISYRASNNAEAGRIAARLGADCPGKR